MTVTHRARGGGYDGESFTATITQVTDTETTPGRFTANTQYTATSDLNVEIRLAWPDSISDTSLTKGGTATVERYRLRYRLASPPNSPWIKDDIYFDGDESHFYRLGKDSARPDVVLENGVTYHIQLQAGNKTGFNTNWWPGIESAARGTSSPPQNFTVMAHWNRLEVYAQKPEDIATTGEVEIYHVQYREVGATGNPTQVTRGANNPGAPNPQGLDGEVVLSAARRVPGTEYEVRVRARTHADGEWSFWKSVIIPSRAVLQLSSADMADEFTLTTAGAPDGITVGTNLPTSGSGVRIVAANASGGGTVSLDGSCPGTANEAITGKRDDDDITLLGCAKGETTISLYECSGTTALTTYTVTVAEPLAAPSGFNALGADTEATLNWSAPHDETITHWEYDVKSDSSDTTDDWVEITGGGTKRSFTLTSLTNGTTYTFKVRAVAGTAVGTATSTDSATPTAPPSSSRTEYWSSTMTAGSSSGGTKGFSNETGFTFDSLTDDDFQLESGGTTYTVTQLMKFGTGVMEFRLNGIRLPNGSGEAENAVRLEITDSASTTTNIPLENQWNTSQNEYRFNTPLQFDDTAGSNTYTVKLADPGTAADPGKPVLTVGSITGTTVMLTWTLPVDDRTITTWQLKYTDSATPPKVVDWASISSKPGTRAHLVTGLTSGLAYTFQIRATNPTGTTASDEVSTAAKPDAPVIRATPGAQSGGNWPIVVNWTAPNNNGADITRYKYSSKQGSAAWSTPFDIGTVLSYTQTNANAGVTYTFRVRAVNSVGTSDWSNEATAITGAPQAPVILLSTGDSVIFVEATGAPEDNGASINDYDVRYKLTSDTTWTSHADDANDDPSDSGTLDSSTNWNINLVTNGATYEVQMRAANSRGEGPWSDVVLQTVGVPEVPSVSLVPGGTQIVATIQAGWHNGDAITGYTLEYRDPRTETAQWLPHSVTDATETRTITGLTPTIEYEVRVKATNGRGDSQWSEIVSQVAGAPLAPVINQPTPGNGQVTVTWAAPTSNNGDAVIDYDVEYRSFSTLTWTLDTTDGNDDSSDSSTLDTATSRTLTLTNGTEYLIRVRAQNGRGESPWSVSDPGIPGAPLAPEFEYWTPGSTFATMGWTVPNGNGSEVTDYDLRHKDTSEDTWIAIPHDTGANGAFVSGLTAGNTYEFQVRASNDRGAGPWSDSISFTAGVPRAPILAPLTPGGTQITATWTADFPNGDAITKFTVQHRVKNPQGAWTSNEITGTPPATSYNITGLTATTDYEVRVKATNGRGDSQWSAILSQIAGAPLAPVINLPTPGNGQATVTWAAPTSNNGDAVIDYDVDYRSFTSPMWNAWTPDTTDSNDDPSDSSTLETALTRDISGLTNGTLYEFRVRAQNGRGESPWSPMCQARPGVPLAPTGLTLTPGNLHIVANWTAPTSNNGSTITEYVVVYRPNGGSWVTTSVAGTPPVTTVTLSSLTNGTTYEVFVQAENAHGIGAASDTVTATPVTTAPGKPTLSLTAGDAQITASWTVADDGGETITGYTVRHRVKDPQGSWTTNNVTGSPPATSYEITGLTNGTEYEVEVNATNSKGTGDWSDTQSGTPTAPGAPQNLGLTARDEQIAVDWETPANTGTQPITSYLVEWKISTSSTWTSHTVSGTPLPTEYTITGLTNGTQYDVKVSATNSVGTGPATDEMSTTPVTTPGAPTLTLSPGNMLITASWSLDDDGGSAITDYGIEYRVKDTTTWFGEGEQDTNTSYVIQNLTNGTVYEVRVHATNGVGDGPYSDVLEATPSPDLAVPSPPQNLQLTPGDTQIEADWDAPARDGRTDISGYVVEYRVKDTTNWLNNNHTGTGTNDTITGLTNGTTYEVRISATNSVGTGDPSAIEEATPGTEFLVPDAPVATLIPGNQRIDIVWPEPDNNGSAITDYDVQYSVPPALWSDHPDDGPNSDPSLDLTRALTGLTNGLTYDMRVRAENANGESQWSDVVTATVGQPGAPQNVVLTPGETTIVATWTPSVDNGLGFEKQRVRYRALESGQASTCEGSDGWTRMGINDSTTSEFTISNVEPLVVYEMQIRGGTAVSNGNIWGYWSECASAQIPTAPDAPVLSAQAGNAQITLTWTVNDNGGPITGYELSYQPQGGEEVRDTLPGDDFIHRSYIVIGLTNGTPYTLRLKAQNTKGESPWPNTVTATPTAGEGTYLCRRRGAS